MQDKEKAAQEEFNLVTVSIYLLSIEEPVLSGKHP